MKTTFIISNIFGSVIKCDVQVEDVQGKVGVLDVVARFRVRNMSGYVTVYYNFADPDPEKDVRDLVRNNQDDKKQARREFFAVK